MITIYDNGKDFLLENKHLLDKNKYKAGLFYIDAKVLETRDDNNYAIKCSDNDKTLLAIKLSPYNTLLYGDKECLEELLKYLFDNNFVFDGIMCSTDIGEQLLKISDSVCSKQYDVTLAMDYMITDKKTEKSSDEVIWASADDVDEIFDCCNKFFKDCGLPDKPSKDNLLKKIGSFAILKESGIIVSMASCSVDTDDSYRITHVYTRPELRGKGYARKVVNYLKNYILAQGKTATLNVDKKNPISNHLYESLGFEKLFSQSVYIAR